MTNYILGLCFALIGYMFLTEIINLFTAKEWSYIAALALIGNFIQGHLIYQNTKQSLKDNEDIYRELKK